MTDTAVKTPRRRRRDKREDILTAASTLFARFGFRKTTVDEIAQAARVAKGTLYKYFQSKEEVFNRVTRRESEQIFNKIRTAVEQADTRKDKIRTLARVKAEEIRKAVSFHQIAREVAQELWPILDSVRNDYTRQEAEMLRDIIIDGNKAGEFDVSNPELAACAVATVLKALELEWILDRNPEQLQQDVDQFIELLFRGIVSRADSSVS